MEPIKTEAPATAASTPEMTNKDSNNLLTNKVLSPKFDSLTATEIKEHVEQLAGKTEPVEHGAILGELLKSIEPFDFESAVYPQAKQLREKYVKLQSQLTNSIGSEQGEAKSNDLNDELKEIQRRLNGFKLSRKHYAIHAIENIIEIAKRNKWNICKNNYFIYLYNGEYWANIEQEAFQKFLGEAAERMGVPKYDSRWFDFREILFKQFLALSYLTKPKKRENVTLINLKNGTFEITLAGHKLRPFDSGDFLTYQLPFAYDPNAQAPLFEKYLNEVQPDILRQNILAEFLGYIFTDLNLEKALLLLGLGANGKSVFFNVTNALLGDENISQYSLANLTDEKGFYRAKINNKLLNYCSDISTKMGNAIFKQLVSCEPVEACLKYGQPFNMVKYAKLIFNCNELPRNAEQTNAYFRRFLIINFEKTIPDDKQDGYLSKKIIDTELSGVFNWVLLGLNRLLLQKKFTVSEAVNDARKQYELESDSVNQFIEDSDYKASPNDYKPIVELYRDYRGFCIEDGCQAVKKGNFIKRLKHLKITVDRLNIGNVAYLTKTNEPF